MTAINERARTPRITLGERGQFLARPRQGTLRRHDAAVIQAEVRRLARALSVAVGAGQASSQAASAGARGAISMRT